jgi:hypothetical protein
MPGGREIENGQPPEPERYPRFCIDPFTCIVGASMDERIAHQAYPAR